MRIDVDPTGTAAAGAAAGQLARILRQVMGRLEAVLPPTAAGTAALPAWAVTWATLRPALLALAVAGDHLAEASRVAGNRFRETENGLLVPDGR